MSLNRQINKLQPDLVFLDTNFENNTGFDLLKKFQNIDFQIILTADSDDYAMEAYKVHAIDYLLKPIHQKALELALQRVHDFMDYSLEQEKNIKLQENLSNWSMTKKLAVKESKSINYIDIENIVHLKADGNYTNIVLKDGKNLISSKVLKHYDQLLSNYGFLRVHRSNMINLNYVKEFRHKYGGSIVLKNNEVIGIEIIM